MGTWQVYCIILLFCVFEIFCNRKIVHFLDLTPLSSNHGPSLPPSQPNASQGLTILSSPPTRAPRPAGSGPTLSLTGSPQADVLAWSCTISLFPPHLGAQPPSPLSTPTPVPPPPWPLLLSLCCSSSPLWPLNDGVCRARGSVLSPQVNTPPVPADSQTYPHPSLHCLPSIFNWMFDLHPKQVSSFPLLVLFHPTNPDLPQSSPVSVMSPQSIIWFFETEAWEPSFIFPLGSTPHPSASLSSQLPKYPKFTHLFPTLLPPP